MARTKPTDADRLTIADCRYLTARGRTYRVRDALPTELRELAAQTGCWPRSGRTFRLTLGSERQRCYLLPSLGHCRTLFAEKLDNRRLGGNSWETMEWQHAEPWRPGDEATNNDWDPEDGYYARQVRKAPF
jgi:hypothetical protein